jgi:hypothetical protein
MYGASGARTLNVQRGEFRPVTKVCKIVSVFCMTIDPVRFSKMIGISTTWACVTLTSRGVVKISD